MLGRGSTGTVYAAHDPVAQRLVALKLTPLDGGLGDDPAHRADAQKRRAAEAAGARRLAHPHIVAVLDDGVDGAMAWLAMELVAGTALSRYTAPSRLLPLPVVLQTGQRLADALGHAHRAGVVHRDVKPANVLVDWVTDSLKLADFGLARLAGADATRTGLVLGSPAFMAPELLAGAPPAAASDLYALGMSVFQLLSGQLPHDGLSMGALLRRVATAPAPDVRTLRPDIPTPVAALVAALLERRPADRPADGRALSERFGQLR